MESVAGGRKILIAQGADRALLGIDGRRALIGNRLVVGRGRRIPGGIRDDLVTGHVVAVAAARDTIDVAIVGIVAVIAGPPPIKGEPREPIVRPVAAVMPPVSAVMPPFSAMMGPVHVVPVMAAIHGHVVGERAVGAIRRHAGRHAVRHCGGVAAAAPTAAAAAPSAVAAAAPTTAAATTAAAATAVATTSTAAAAAAVGQDRWGHHCRQRHAQQADARKAKYRGHCRSSFDDNHSKHTAIPAPGCGKDAGLPSGVGTP